MAYTSVEKIAKVRLMCHKVLPAVYDESLSYLEAICKLTYKLNESIDAVNALDDNVEALNDTVIEYGERLTAVEGEIDGFEAEIRRQIAAMEVEFKAEMDAAVAQMDEKVDSKLSEVDAKLNEVDTKLDDMEARITAMENYVQTAVDRLTAEFTAIITAEIQRINELYVSFEAEMRQYVEDVVNELIQQIPDLTNIYVISPASGKLVKVQVAINEVFDFHLYNALTCDEFNSLGLSCEELNTLMVDSLPRGFTVREWLHDAKQLLMKILPAVKVEKWLPPNSIVRGYLTGVKDYLYKNVDLNAAVWMWSGTYTCDEFNTVGKTCDEINALNMTIDEYLMHGNTILV